VFLGESGPFCPICFGLTCWYRPLSAIAVFNSSTNDAIGRIPTRNSDFAITLWDDEDELVDRGDVSVKARMKWRAHYTHVVNRDERVTGR
jgi:hypothetical protein